MNELESQAREGRINENASIRDRQAAIINAPIEKVWKILTLVNEWPNWNPEIKSARAEKVQARESFDWHIKHSHFQSIFQVVNEPTLLTWTGKSKLVKSIFVWNLEASDNQTIVTVEESIEGFVIPLFNNHSKLHDILIDWLKALKSEAEK
jgi:uncharacterized protein YndB with AHSA1/START domain